MRTLTNTRYNLIKKTFDTGEKLITLHLSQKDTHHGQIYARRSTKG